MSKIARFDIAKLRREELLSFNNKVLLMLRPALGAQTTFERFEKAAEHFRTLMSEKAYQSSTALEDYDRESDKAWTALKFHLKASVLHPEPKIREAAEKIQEIFEKTDNPTHLSYDKEYGALQNLLTQLAKLPPELFQQSLSEPYRQALQKAVELFALASDEKLEALVKREAGALKNAAIDCKQAWQSLILYLEYHKAFDSPPELDEAFDKVALFCDELRRAQRKAHVQQEKT